MNPYVSLALRDLACGAAAALITLIVSASFVQSTATPPGSYDPHHPFVALHAEHAWFGQPEPAVLVD